MQTRVLIVDPDISFVVRIKQALEQTGDYEVIVFATGQAALEQAGRQRHDVAVVSFALHDMDGPALVGRLRQVQPDLAIIVVPHGKQPLPEGTEVEGVLPKPYRVGELDLALQQAIEIRLSAPAPKTVLLAHLEEDTELDDYMTLTEDISVQELSERQKDEVRRQAEDLPPGPLDHLPAPDADVPLDTLLEKLESDQDARSYGERFGSYLRGTGPLPPPSEDPLSDHAFDDILELMADRESEEGTEPPGPETDFLPGFDEPATSIQTAREFEEGQPEALPFEAIQIEDTLASMSPAGIEEMVEEEPYGLESFERAIARIAAEPPSPPIVEPEEGVRSGQEPAPIEELAMAEDTLVEAPVEDIEAAETPPSAPEAAPTVAEDTDFSLDELLGQIEQQVAEATTEATTEATIETPPKIKRLPPRKIVKTAPKPESKRKKPRKARRTKAARRGGGLMGLFGGRAARRAKKKPTPQEPSLGELEILRPAQVPAEPEPTPRLHAGEVPDWLAEEMPKEFLGSAAGEPEMAKLAQAPAEPITAPEALPGEALDWLAEEVSEEPLESAAGEPQTPLLAEPVIVEPTLQSGTANLTPAILLAEEAEPLPLPRRAPDEWQPAFPAEAEPAEREGIAREELPTRPRWEGVEPAEPPIQYTKSAKATLRLSHIAMESLAEVLLLMRDRRLLGYAGQLQSRDALDLAAAVYEHWDPEGGRRQAQVQFVRLVSISRDYILYSIATGDHIVLSMAFLANTPLGKIRRHAREIAWALRVEETGQADLRAEVEAEPAAGQAQPEPREPLQVTSCSCLWTLRDPSSQLDDDQKQILEVWLAELAAAQNWSIEVADIWPEYVSIQVEVPITDKPAGVVEALMGASSDRMLEAYPDRLAVSTVQGLWADGYYVVTPGRALSEGEIARFISDQRGEQGAAGS